MVNIIELFTDFFKELKEKVTNSFNKKDTKSKMSKYQDSSYEIRNQTKESMVQTTQEIKTQLEKSSSRAKLNTQKIISDNSHKNDKVSTKDLKPVKSQTKITSKKIEKKENTQKKFPSGKIVNSVILSEVERGYLELAGFKNYKDAFLGLETSKKRSSIAKQVATQPTTMTTILKKLELLQVKGVGENLAFLLVQVGINSVQKLAKADASKLIKKIQDYLKIHSENDIKLSQKKLENIQKEAKLVTEVFN
ncbi:MAG: helix-hairpin-helix domain-containing protein [Candidatus Woesearchaeota archaeon]